MSRSLFLTLGARLTRPAIAALAAYSALTGSLLASGWSLTITLLPALAVFMLASGASALNQYQEQKTDARMGRTRHRPLPSGKIRPGQALVVAFLFIASGLALLGLSNGLLPALLGFAALIWYNGVYTPLKRWTAFAAIPGAVVGMIPPAIGWSAGGGTLSDSRLFALCFVFFMWQVPHFWLQLLDYGHEYEQAGLPALTQKVGRRQLTRMTFVWTCAAAVAGLLLPLYGTIHDPSLFFLLLPAAAASVVAGTRLLACFTSARVRSAFRTVNVYMLVVMSLLCLDGLFLPL